MSDARTRRLSALVFGVIALVWGFNWVVLKIAMREAAPFEFLPSTRMRPTAA